MNNNQNKTNTVEETLKKHKKDFSKLNQEVDHYQEQFNKKLYQQIKQLEKQQEKRVKQLTNKRKALALKSQVYNNYVIEQDWENVPIDGQIKPGSVLYMNNCAACHSLQGIDSKQHKAPSLGVIYNRRVASNTLFPFYSKQMLVKSFFWTSKNLYKFMEDANALIPGNKCNLVKKSIKSQQDRADLIKFFKQYSREMIFNMRLKQIQKIGFQAYQSNLQSQDAQRLREIQKNKIQQKKKKQI